VILREDSGGTHGLKVATDFAAIFRRPGPLHVYGGDFFAPGRSEWDSETLLEQPCDPKRMAERFEEANARLKGAVDGGARRRRR